MESVAQRSFRDPAGSFVLEEARGLRTVKEEYVRDTLAFLKSRVAREWTENGRLIATEVIDEPSMGSALRLAHPRIFFPSYVWEWTPGQLSAAGELTLDLCEELIEEGWILKDATPSNILFEGARPVFVDVLSAERRDPENPLWMAYGQFIRTFLLPLAAYRSLGWPLSTALNRHDGYEPEELYAALGPLERLQAPWLSLVTLPVVLGRRKARGGVGMRRPAPVAQAVLKHTLRSLRASLKKLKPPTAKSRWTNYPQDAVHYSTADLEGKIHFVRECASLAKPQHVLDIGANTGFFSRLVAATGARVVAWDSDVAATELSWQQALQEGVNVMPLVADYARPTPGIGWNNAETSSLLARSCGRFDMVMMLAVLHHLLASRQIPLDYIAKLTRELTRDFLLIEWVGPSDPKFQELIKGRDSLYGHLDEHAFMSAFSPYFRPIRHKVLGNSRVLHLMEAI